MFTGCDGETLQPQQVDSTWLEWKPFRGSKNVAPYPLLKQGGHVVNEPGKLHMLGSLEVDTLHVVTKTQLLQVQAA